MAKIFTIFGLCLTLANLAFAQVSDTSIEKMLATFVQQNVLTYGRLLTGQDPLGPLRDEVKFLCYNRNTNEYIRTYVDDPALSSKLDPTKPLHIFTHGWISGTHLIHIQDVMQDMKTYLDVNACVVDWAKMANFRYDISATKHVPMVGDYIAEFVVQAKNFGIPLDDVTLIGHSLGAQIVGQAGLNVSQSSGSKVGVIFGLDPAGPRFSMQSDVGTAFRLDSSDAKFVQVIHTSDNIFGSALDQGHQDFRPDGGLAPQAACIAPIFDQTISCSHNQAILYYRYSLNPANRFTGRQCNSWLDFIDGKCNAQTSPVTSNFGPYINKELRGRFYYRASPFAPFTPIPETGNPIVDALAPIIVLLTGLLEFLTRILQNVLGSILKL